MLAQAARIPGILPQRWLTRCDCGHEAPVIAKFLVIGRCQQCIHCTKKMQSGPGHPFWRGGKHTPITHFHKFKRGAKRRGIEFKVSIGDIDALYETQGMKCALTGVPLLFDHGQNNGVKYGNASLDRKRSDIGYIIGNIQLVTKDVNIAKQSRTDEEFIEICRQVVNHADKKQ